MYIGTFNPQLAPNVTQSPIVKHTFNDSPFSLNGHVYNVTCPSSISPGRYIFGNPFTLTCSGNGVSGDWFLNDTDLHSHGTQYRGNATFESAGTYECRSSGSVHVTLGVIVLGEFTALYTSLCVASYYHITLHSTRNSDHSHYMPSNINIKTLCNSSHLPPTYSDIDYWCAIYVTSSLYSRTIPAVERHFLKCYSCTLYLCVIC